MSYKDIDLTDRDTLASLIEERGGHIRGNIVKCPYHDDRRPSASIFEGKDGNWRFHCMGCNETRDARAVYKELRGGSEDYAFEVKKYDYKSTDKEKTYSREELDGFKNIKKCYEYYDKKGQPVHLEYRYETKGFDGKISKRFNQYRMIANDVFMSGHPEPCPLYNWQNVVNEEVIFLVEGAKCVEAMTSVGLPAVTWTGGSEGYKYSDISFLAGKKIIALPDNDADSKSYRAMAVVKDKLGEDTDFTLLEPEFYLSKFMIPKAKDDMADVVAKLYKDYKEANPDGDKLDALTEASAIIFEEFSEWLVDEKLDAFDEYMNDYVFDKIASGWFRGYDIGWDKLEDTSDWTAGDSITVLCADSGTGKSMMAADFARRLLTHTDAKVAWRIGEDDKNKHTMRIIGQILNQSNLARRKNIEDGEQIRNEYKKACQEHRGLITRVLDCMEDSKDRTYESLNKWVTKKAEEGADVIIIDPISIFSSDGGIKSLVEDTKNIVQRLDALKSKYGCRFLVVTHPRNKDGGISKDNIYGGRDWDRFVQNIMWLSKIDPIQVPIATGNGFEEATVNRVIKVLKMRDGTENYGDTIGFNFDSKTLRFEEVCDMRDKNYRVIQN